jgi:hypothetical protein
MHNKELDQIKEDEMGESYNAHVGDNTYIQNSGPKIWGKDHSDDFGVDGI